MTHEEMYEAHKRGDCKHWDGCPYCNAEYDRLRAEERYWERQRRESERSTGGSDV